MIYLLDTDTLTHLHLGHQRVKERLRAAGVSQIATTLISRIEMLQGRMDYLLKAASGPQLLHAQQLLERTEIALRQLPIMPLDSPATAEFDHLRQSAALRKIGRADLLIAAIALANRATLVTRNVRHFERVPGLRLANWLD
jgi:tRNA(fMet)-specific endonuclease VapC